MIGLDANGHHQQPKQTICFRGTGARISQAEKDAYDKRVIVRWQPKAYYDQALCAEWCLLDFNSQVDAGSKKDEYLALLPDNLEKWTSGFNVSQRRVLITEWVGEAIERVFNRMDMVNLFVRTGQGLARDGSTDDVVKLSGVQDYCFVDADGDVAITERAKSQAVIEIVPNDLEEVQVDNAEENVEGGIMVPSENPNTVFTEQKLDEAEDVIASDMLAEEEEAENSDAESSDDEGEEEIFTVEKLGAIKNVKGTR
ncbi:hypothetical protein CYMTET_31796 [Cymbomonas tetramitiformis]|uniref:Uncharacterized protein n=1 Tax=Cymbomonas tetramitiformis TaxID=36881 RepID=A0AAE0FG51_9CHLO|nr:hypothetical protein CYMTET_31796 [Cymbomonas tetramitiformis]